jgi:hypothetical protein
LIELQRDAKSASPSGKRPKSVKAVRQNTDRDRLEWTAFLDRPVDLPQTIDLIHQQVAGPLSENDRKEEKAAFSSNTTLLRHDALYHGIRWWARRKSAFAHPSVTGLD